MTRRITALEPQQKRRDRVNMFLDGVYALSLSTAVLARYGYAKGDSLSPAEIEALKEADRHESAYEAALQLLSYRPRSIAEVRRRLLQRHFEPPLVDEVLHRLTDHGLLDDTSFAQYWKDNRDAHSPRGERLLKAELRQKGVDDEVIAEAVDDVDEEENAYRAVISRARRYKALDFRTFHQKVGGFLLRRGFGYEVARTVTDRLWEECRDAGAEDDQWSSDE